MEPESRAPKGTCSHHFPASSPSTGATEAHKLPFCQVYETPFYVAVDHDKKKVVISIRGTLSPKVRHPVAPPNPGPLTAPGGLPPPLRAWLEHLSQLWVPAAGRHSTDY